MKDNTMPSLESIKEGRSNQAVYTKYCDLFLLDIVHRNKWNRVIATEKLTCVAMRSDEAFGILVLANNWARAAYWAEEEQAGTDEGVIKKNHPATLYTKEGGNTQVDMGWIDKGLIEMMQLCSDVETDRELNGKEFNKYFMAKKREVGPLKRKSTKTGSNETVEQKKARTVPDDFDMDDQSDDQSDNDDDDE